jgi:4-hydroxy-3-polyprenylbenzoate decarboxylase
MSKVTALQDRKPAEASESKIVGERKERLIIGITGASGVVLGIKALELLRQIEAIETHLVISPAAEVTIAKETDWKISDVLALADVHYSYQDIGAPIASGSFPAFGMIVLPCSVKTLSAIANSFAADLISRAADVTLKEGRPLLLAVRETPLHRGHIRLMDLAAEVGAIIFPPVPAFYTMPQTMDDVVQNLVGRLLARIGIENDAYLKWGGIGDE